MLSALDACYPCNWGGGEDFKLVMTKSEIGLS